VNKRIESARLRHLAIVRMAVELSSMRGGKRVTTDEVKRHCNADARFVSSHGYVSYRVVQYACKRRPDLLKHSYTVKLCFAKSGWAAIVVERDYDF
jgi:hypothetical protein